MFARWFTRLDQGLEAMVGRYAGAKSTRHETPRFRSHDARILFLAKESKRGVFFKELSDDIRRDGHAELRNPRAVIEFAWLMFFLKDWVRLAAVIREMGPRHALPGHLADLYFLTIYRLNRETLAKGINHDGFNDTVSDAIAFIRRHWPAESHRADLFSALLQNSLGNQQEARGKIIRLAAQLELIPPLAAAKATLPKPNSRDTAVWLLEIVRSSRKRATLVSIDQVYYERYAASFLAIHTVTNPDRCVHFHCVGFDPRGLDGIVEIDGTIGFTIDRTDITDLNPRDKQGYYANARLMHAIVYLDVYDDILISDFDGSVDLSASDILAEQADADVIIKSKILQPGHTLFNLPWATIPAAANMVRNSVGGRLFAQYLRDYLSDVLTAARRKERPMWFADQCALFYAYLDLKDQVVFRNCNKTLYNQGRNWSPFESQTVKKDYIENALREHNLTN